MLKRYLEPLTPVVGALAFILIWWIFTWLKVIDPVLLPSPQDSAKALWKGLFEGTLAVDTIITIRRTLYAFVIAVFICVPLGLILGSSARLYRSCDI